MRIAVIGPGAIGCLVAGYLKGKGEDVTLVGRSDAVRAIKEKGLSISGVRGNFSVRIGISETLNYIPELLILATKTQDIDAALKDSSHLLHNSLVLTTQNGVQADTLVSKYISKDNIISSIIMFGATALEAGKVVHNFEGSWVLGSFFNPNPTEAMLSLSLVLDEAFPTIISEDIKGMKYLKIFVNANNCLPAIIGKSMQDVFSDLTTSRISIAIWKEAFEIFDKLGIDLVSLPGFPVENITKLTSMPSEQAAGVFSHLMSNLSREPLYGSILQSIMRGKLSEIDYINGEFVRLAEENNMRAPLNKVLVDMVHEVEENGRFFSKEDLIDKTKELI
ncbi:MAG: ketopantoate reductase family protein [Candidatus Omnitrophica bacterium]|jgi:2-dehydropantoate 2-reductase|nr:ketopantoate reductase family protein [Candidatus Omnitrophota bacterium]MDD5661228.1 ketopantoate reductase family protein [Candidatus Omnitrophota bacterium]